MVVQRVSDVRDIYARAWIQDDAGIYYTEQQDDTIRIHWQDGEQEDC